MKKNLMYAMLVALLAIGGQMNLFAQDKSKENKDKKPPRPTQEQVMQMQTDQMVRTLMLDDATTAKFKPVYEQYLKELRECRNMNRPARQKDAKKDDAPKANITETDNVEAKKKTPKQDLTDEEIATLLKNQFAQSRKLLDIREKYYTEFSKILTQKQIMKIYQEEKNTTDRFKREFDRRKDQRPPVQRPRP